MSDSTTAVDASRFARFRGSLTRRDWTSLGGMYGFIIVLHVVGFGVLFGFVVPNHYQLGGDHPVFAVGVGVLAYTFGLRHAFDADHIAAVDNTTRKLMADNAGKRGGRRPRSRDPQAALGRVLVLPRPLDDRVRAGVPALASASRRWPGRSRTTTPRCTRSPASSAPRCPACSSGSSASSTSSCCSASSRCSGRCAPAATTRPQLEDQLNKRGFMNRFLGGLTKSVRKPWHIYPIGVLFGLGFDTATEVGLLVLAGGAAAFNLPFYAILVLPILFAAGMCLMDTTDGVFMNAAYGWAFAKPVRKVFYNITITSISVAVALIIGTIELIGVLADQANITPGRSPRSRPSRSTTPATPSSPSSCSPGSRRSRSGASAASRRSGRRTSPPAPTPAPDLGAGAIAIPRHQTFAGPLLRNPISWMDIGSRVRRTGGRSRGDGAVSRPSRGPRGRARRGRGGRPRAPVCPPPWPDTPGAPGRRPRAASKPAVRPPPGGAGWDTACPG